jgi:hypothetical protein
VVVVVLVVEVVVVVVAVVVVVVVLTWRQLHWLFSHVQELQVFAHNITL